MKEFYRHKKNERKRSGEEEGEMFYGGKRVQKWELCPGFFRWISVFRMERGWVGLLQRSEV